MMDNKKRTEGTYEKTELLHLDEIKARYQDCGLSADEYKKMPISEMARMRTDIKRLLLYIDQLRAHLPDNKALTVEELREMGGQPAWIVAHPDWGHWELSECAEDYFGDRDEDFYGMTMPPTLPDPMGRYGLHMMGWLAYRRPPEKGE